jgi:hypothetical protein
MQRLLLEASRGVVNASMPTMAEAEYAIHGKDFLIVACRRMKFVAAICSFQPPTAARVAARDAA